MLHGKKAQAKKRDSPKVNSPDAIDTEDDDLDLDSQPPDGIFALQAKPRPAPFAHANPFADLSEDDGDAEDKLPENMVNQFSQWAHKVQKEKKPKHLHSA